MAENAEKYANRLVSKGFDDWFVLGSLSLKMLKRLAMPWPCSPL